MGPKAYRKQVEDLNVELTVTPQRPQVACDRDNQRPLNGVGAQHDQACAAIPVSGSRDHQQSRRTTPPAVIACKGLALFK